MGIKRTKQYRNKLKKCLIELENLNGAICIILNEMLCDNACEKIHDDVQFALNSNFCRGEHLLVGLMEAFDEVQMKAA